MTKNTKDEHGGRPNDTGNGMSDRSGYTGDSETGLTDTPVGSGAQTDGGPDTDMADMDGSGTTFDGGSATPEH